MITCRHTHPDSTVPTAVFRRRRGATGLLLPVLLLLSALSAGALEIVNDSPDLFYFMVIQTDEDLTLEQARDMLNAREDRLAYIPPHSLTLLEPATASGRDEGSAQILGIRVQPGSERYTLVLHRAQHEVLYLSDLDTIEGSVFSWDVSLATSGVRIDGRFAEWVDIAPVAAWPSHLRPIDIVRGEDDAERNVSHQQSLFWGRSGSVPDEMKALLAGDYLYLYLSSVSPYTSAYSAYLTVSTGEEDFTLELYLEDDARLVFLRTDDAQLSAVGDLAYSRFFLEARIRLSDLPFIPGPETTITLATAVYDGGLFERFVIGEVLAERILATGRE